MFLLLVIKYFVYLKNDIETKINCKYIAFHHFLTLVFDEQFQPLKIIYQENFIWHVFHYPWQNIKNFGIQKGTSEPTVRVTLNTPYDSELFSLGM